MPESKLEKTLAGFENTKQLFAKSTPGRYFALIRNVILAVYFLPLLVSIGLVHLTSNCVVTQTPLSASGCQFMQIDMNSTVEFYYHTHIAGFLGVLLFILIIKAFFMIKFINVKIAPENKTND